MDRATILMQLVEARRQIVRATANVALQREVVAKLEQDGHDSAALARMLLVNFEKVLALEIEDQQLLERELRTLASRDER